jgi:hypothetical protein
MTDEQYGRYNGTDYAPPAPPHHHHRRRHWGRYVILTVAVFGLTMAGVLALRGSLPGVHAKPLTCKQQYAQWKTGPAKAEAAKMITAMNATQTAATSEDLPLTRSALIQAGTDARALQAYPVPACADRAGYWAQTLSLIAAAGDNAGASSGLGGLLTAMAPLQKVPPLEAKFGNEVKTTTR